jgi:hypothetical protein
MSFKQQQLNLIHTEFDSYLTILILELDFLRKKASGGTYPKIFKTTIILSFFVV